MGSGISLWGRVWNESVKHASEVKDTMIGLEGLVYTGSTLQLPTRFMCSSTWSHTLYSLRMSVSSSYLLHCNSCHRLN